MEPTVLTQGTSVSWTTEITDKSPADGWAAQYIFVDSTDTQTLDGTDNGDDSFLFELTAAQSATFNVSEYRWQLFVSQGTDRTLENESFIVVNKDFGTTTDGTDTRSHVKKTLDSLEAVIEQKATKDQSSWTIKNRTLSRMSPEELIDWYQKYKLWYRQELKADSLKQGGRQELIRVRFSNV